jgi:hypothetical protein
VTSNKEELVELAFFNVGNVCHGTFLLLYYGNMATGQDMESRCRESGAASGPREGICKDLCQCICSGADHLLGPTLFF